MPPKPPLRGRPRSGPYVTHGILFDTGSDRPKPESAPVIQSIAFTRSQT
jgi:hypothetical protein